MSKVRLSPDEAQKIPLIRKALEAIHDAETKEQEQVKGSNQLAEINALITDMSTKLDSLSMRATKLELGDDAPSRVRKVNSIPVVPMTKTRTPTAKRNTGFLFFLMITREIVRMLKRYG